MHRNVLAQDSLWMRATAKRCTARGVKDGESWTRRLKIALKNAKCKIENAKWKTRGLLPGFHFAFYLFNFAFSME
jgi:hypothetical protein